MYKLTPIEQETIYLYNEGEDTAVLDTFDKGIIKKLRRAAEKYPDVYSVSEPDKYGGVTARFPKNAVTLKFQPPMSAEERAHRSEMAKQDNRADNLRKLG